MRCIGTLSSSRGYQSTPASTGFHGYETPQNLDQAFHLPWVAQCADGMGDQYPTRPNTALHRLPATGTVLCARLVFRPGRGQSCGRDIVGLGEARAHDRPTDVYVRLRRVTKCPFSSNFRVCLVASGHRRTGAERMRTIALILFMLSNASALAHGTEPHGAVATWTFDPWIVTPLLVLGLLYAAGLAVLWRRTGMGRQVRGWQAVAYFAGWMSLALALVSPLHWLGEHLFTFHMIEHEIVMAISAPLLVMSRPIGPFLWSMPRRTRVAVGRFFRRPAVIATWQRLSSGRNAT